ncbi:hypothetical protein KR067_005992 [Drosophila pandora]|nr:hypothetical protein KR067_005992 [Drosophila pandora]
MDKDLQAAMEVEPKNPDLEEIGKQILEQPIEKQEIEAMEKVEILPMEEDFKLSEDDLVFSEPEILFEEEPPIGKGEMPEAPKPSKEGPKRTRYCPCSMPADEEIAAMSEDELLDFLIDVVVFFPEDMRRHLLPYALENLKSLSSRILLKLIRHMMEDCAPEGKLTILCNLGHCRRKTKSCNRMFKVNQRRQQLANQPVFGPTGSSNGNLVTINASGDRVEVPILRKVAKSVTYSAQTCAKICAINCARIFIEALENNTLMLSPPNLPNMTAKNIAALSSQIVARLVAPKGAKSGEGQVDESEAEKMIKITAEDVAEVSADLLSQLGINIPTNNLKSMDITDEGVNRITSQLIAKLEALVAHNGATKNGAKLSAASAAPDGATNGGSPSNGGAKLNNGVGSSSGNGDGTLPNTDHAAFNTGKSPAISYPQLSEEEAERISAAITAKITGQDSVKLSARLSARQTAKYFGTTTVEIAALNTSAETQAANYAAKVASQSSFDVHHIPKITAMVSARKAVTMAKLHWKKYGDKSGLLAKLEERNPMPRPRKIISTLIGGMQFRKRPHLEAVRRVTQGRAPHRMEKLAVTKVVYEVEDVADYIFDELCP